MGAYKWYHHQTSLSAADTLTAESVYHPRDLQPPSQCPNSNLRNKACSELLVFLPTHNGKEGEDKTVLRMCIEELERLSTPASNGILFLSNPLQWNGWDHQVCNFLHEILTVLSGEGATRNHSKINLKIEAERHHRIHLESFIKAPTLQVILAVCP